MKNSIAYCLLAVSLFLLSSCTKKGPGLLDPTGNQFEADKAIYESICGSANGELAVEIGGKKWGNSCAVFTVYPLGSTLDSFSFYIASYTDNGILLNNGAFEWFAIAGNIYNGIGTYQIDESIVEACYYEGIFDYATANGSVYINNVKSTTICTDDNSKGFIKITDRSDNELKGSFEMSGFNGETGAEVTMKGSFGGNL
ncbi:MAG: hypothetical protein KDD27_19845 [Saprospiraceae bacterium]|nr:hypothetical protein [Saprospiraceae bacterium]